MRARHGTLLICLCLAALDDARSQVPGRFEPVVGTRADLKPFYFSIPAPRGQILDRKGRPLAQTVTMRRIQIVAPLKARDTLEHYSAWVEETLEALRKDISVPLAVEPEALKRHHTHRRDLPLTVSAAFAEEKIAESAGPLVHLRTEYVRSYPEGDLAAHALGYVASDGPTPVGPVLHEETLRQRTKGAAGLESAFNQQLTGKDGVICLMMADEGKVAHKQVFTPPVPGRDLVTTLNLETQRLAEKSLSESKHRGAIVIVDAFTGDIRALASNPRYDPNSFARGISTAEFETLSKSMDGPLFDRAVQASYPPGSVFKPIVVFAGLRALTVDALQEFDCGPTLMIDGREFDNWSKDDRGWFNARSALIRSCNTYFYQSAMITRDAAILQMSREFGLGAAPVLPLKCTAGSLPATAPSNHDLANLSIGQGVTEASPLQIAMMMATIANGACRPRPRLVMQTQSQSGQTGDVQLPVREALLPVSSADLETVRHALFGVVNHASGTAKSARLDKVAVFGKTGTAQWVLRGEKANVVWLAGYIDTVPPLAFAITIEGDPGEGGMSGGGTAAPVIAKVLRDVQAKPAAHGVTYEAHPVLVESDPLFSSPIESPLFTSPPPSARPSSTPVRGFFSRLFR